MAIGGVASFLLYTPVTSVFDDIVRPVVDLPFNASIFLVVFLPLLLFHASLTLDLREIAPDWAPFGDIKIGRSGLCDSSQSRIIRVALGAAAIECCRVGHVQRRA